MLVAQNSLGSVCPVPLTVRGSLTSLSKQLDIITMLVEAGADVNARISTHSARNERSGRTPLLLAAAHTWRIGGSRKYAIIRLLLTLGARIDICDDYGGTVDSILAVHPLLKYYDDEEFWYQKRDHRKAMTLVADVRSAGGTWARYIHEPRVRLDVLRKLCCRGRATPQTYFFLGLPWTHMRARRRRQNLVACLFTELPADVFRHAIGFWRSDHDPPYSSNFPFR